MEKAIQQKEMDDMDLQRNDSDEYFVDTQTVKNAKTVVVEVPKKIFKLLMVCWTDSI